jgi:hypothetical protein
MYRNGEVVTGAEEEEAEGAFARGTFALKSNPGGSVVIVGTGESLRYDVRKGNLSIRWVPHEPALKKDDAVDYFIPWIGISGEVTESRIMRMLRQFGVIDPGNAGYAVEVTRGKTLDRHLFWLAEADGGAWEAKLAQADLLNFVPLVLDGLNDNWSVQLLDRARPWPNHRALPVRDGRSWAELDPVEGDLDLFAGHPVTASDPSVRIEVAWKESPGTWIVEAHNPSDEPTKTALRSSPGWTLFDFSEQVELPPGSSRTWEVEAMAAGSTESPSGTP